MLAGTQFAHVGFTTKLPWYLRLGMTTHILGRWRAADVLACIAEHRIPSLGGVAPQMALLLREDLDAYDLELRADDRHGRRRVAARAWCGRRWRASMRRTPSATRRPRAAGAARARSSTPTRRRRSSPSAGPGAASRSASATTRRARCPTARSARCGSAPPPTMSGYWRDDEATEHALVARLASHRRPRLHRRARLPPPGRPAQGDVHPRWLQRVPGRGGGGARRPPAASPTSRSCPGPTR